MGGVGGCGEEEAGRLGTRGRRWEGWEAAGRRRLGGWVLSVTRRVRCSVCVGVGSPCVDELHSTAESVRLHLPQQPPRALALQRALR